MNPAKTMISMMALLLMGITAIQGAPEEKGVQKNNELQVICSPELESLASQLAGDYMKMNEGTQISVRPESDPAVFENLPKGSLALLSKVGASGVAEESNYKVVVGRNAIVPIMNAANPQKTYILENGISPEGFAMIYTSGDKVSWGEVLGNQEASPVHAYVPGASCDLSYLSEFLQTDPGKLQGFESMDAENMLKMIESDPDAIGFCSLACLMKTGEEELGAGIGFIPVDMDGNGRIGNFENIYSSGSRLSHAIFVGRYPRALFSKVYAVSPKQATGGAEMAFLEWIVSDGQEYMALAGVLELGYSERNAGMEQLSGYDQVVVAVPVKASPARIYLLMGGFFLLLGILIYFISRISGRRSQLTTVASPSVNRSGAYPEGVFFDPSHTWAFMEKNGQVRIGIDDFLQNVTGPVTRVLMKEPGEKIKKGDLFLTLIQNGKRLEIKSPVSGIVEEQNAKLLKDASSLNSDPYTSGWVLMVKPQNWVSELKSYFLGQPYVDWLKNETVRLKDFFAKENSLVMQDGGELRGGVLESCSPEVWEEFQNGFVNTTK